MATMETKTSKRRVAETVKGMVGINAIISKQKWTVWKLRNPAFGVPLRESAGTVNVSKRILMVLQEHKGHVSVPPGGIKQCVYWKMIRVFGVKTEKSVDAPRKNVLGRAD